MKKSLFGLCLLMLSFLTLAGAKRPEWVDSMPQAPHLYQGIGVADDTGSKEEDRLRADQNARTEIIQEISSTISSEVSSYYLEGSISGSVGLAESMEVFSSLSSAYADATIEGIRIVDRYYDKKAKVHYSYATLLRSEFEEQMARKASEARQYAQERYAFAQLALADKNIGAALSHLSQALSEVMVAQSVVKQHLEGDLTGEGSIGFLDIGLSHALTSLISHIKITKLSGDDQKGERNQALSLPLEGRVTYSSGVDELILANIALSLRIEGAEADYQPVITTNEAGIFQARIHTVHSASISNPVARLNLYLPQMQLWLDHSGTKGSEAFPLGVDFHFQMDVVASVRVFVRVIEEINGEAERRSKSEGTLVQALVGKKYSVIDTRQLAGSLSATALDAFVTNESFDELTAALKQVADYAVIGVIVSETSSTGTLNYARANASLNTIDLRSGRIIASGFQENIKAAGNTEAKANATALRKCSGAAIAELLAQMDTALN